MNRLVFIIWWLILIYQFTNADVCQKEGQFQYKTSCYTINSQIEWLDAIMQCRFINAEFLIIESEEEFHNITESLKIINSKDSNLNRSYYIGAEDQLRRGFLKWFRTEQRVPDNFLCAHTINEYNISIDRMKLCAVLDQNLKCIDGRNCTSILPVICETNCSKTAYMKTKLCTDMRMHLEKQRELKTTISTTQLRTTLQELITRQTTVSTTITTTTVFKDLSCENHECKNNAKCISFTKIANKTYLSSLNRTYLCDCKLGFGGHLCEKDLRPCSNYVCIHNSTCESSIENPMEFTCTCMENFVGLFCENNIICDNVTCENGGYCKADYFDFTCECPTYYSGKYCEVKNTDLIVLESVSTSVSVVGTISIIIWLLFLIGMDMSRFLFKIEPKDLMKQRKELRNKKILKRIQNRINRLITRYRKLELEEEEAERIKNCTERATKLEEESAKIESKIVNPKQVKNKKIKREITHFSVHGIKYIDADDNEDDEDDINDRNRLIRRFIEKIWVLNGTNSINKENQN